MGTRFKRKLESTLYAFTSIVLSSAVGFETGNRDFRFSRDDATDLTTNEVGITTGNKKFWDPSVLALWSGKLNPSDATVSTFPGSTTSSGTESNTTQFAQRLLRTGTPALPREGTSLVFLDDVVSALETEGFLASRLPLKRVDVPPENLAYTPYELCFGAGRGTTPNTYFGTGWSSTL